MNKVECICINDKNKPKEIPLSLWVKQGKPYTINHVYYQVAQGIQGCDLDEINLIGCSPFETFKLSRFAFTEENILKLIELAKDCNDLNGIDIDELMKEVEQLETIDI